MELWHTVIHELVIKKWQKLFVITFTIYVLVTFKSAINKENYSWVFNNEIRCHNPHIDKIV